MVESSKILTVSYGTFSCTLEGFDDSFSTMKAIAEYFRDLAERDRYFGAEPPTPDADMLSRIAEREIQRRVEARLQDNKIVLRAAEPEATPVSEPVKAEDVAVETAPEEPSQETVPAMPPISTPPETTPDLEAIATELPAAKETASQTIEAEAMSAFFEDVDDDAGLTFEDMATPTQAAVAAHPDPESVAAKLQRIRAVVSKKPVTDAEDEIDADEAEASDVAEASDIEDAFVEDAEAAPLVLEDAIEDIEEDVQDDVSTSVAEASDIEDEAEDNLAEDASDETERLIADTLTTEAEEEFETPSAQDVEETAKTPHEPEHSEPEQIEVEEPTVASEEANEETLNVSEEAPSDEAESAPETAEVPEKPSIRARILRVARPLRANDTPKVEEPTNGSSQEQDLAADDDTLSDVDSLISRVRAAKPGASATEETETSEDTADAFDDGLSFSDEAADDTMLELADTEEAQDSDVSDDSAENAVQMEDSDQAESLDAPVAGSLSDEDEAELQEELAEVEREVAEDKAKNKSGRDILPENDDEAMSRILNRADAHLSEPEGSRRRNAIAQLKAAVAATEAARQLGDRNEAQGTESEFRKDFDEAIKPRRASALPKTEVRKERPRPAPLKLVAAQRVDAPDAAKSEPVQARRISTAKVDDASASSFAEFAHEMGATELEDLLEAAAAYTAFVEGSPDFSRPQIMMKVQATSETGFSREDSLRSFGTLLRQGRISKVRNGRFQVSEQTRFKPEQKAG